MNILTQNNETVESEIKSNHLNYTNELVRLFKDGFYHECINLSEKLLENQFMNSFIMNIYGTSLSFIGKKEQAIKIFLDGLIHFPKDCDLNNNLAIEYQHIGEYSKAEFYSKIAVSSNPHSSEAYFTLGVSLNLLNKLKEATFAYQKSFKNDPKNDKALLQIANSLKDQKKFSKAIDFYRKHQKLFPNLADGFYGEGCLHIRNQRLSFGWNGYEAGIESRDRCPSKGYYDEKKQLWDGEPFDGTLLIYGEQGIGDQIIFGTLIKDLLKIHTKIILKVHKKLIQLFEINYPEIKILDEDIIIPFDQYEKYISLGSLCKFYRNNISDFNNSEFKRFIAPKNSLNFDKYFFKNKLNVGISWFSFAEQTGLKRSLSIKEISGLIDIDKINFINLQYGDVENQIKQIENQTDKSINTINQVDLSNDIGSISNIINQCDLVITIDNTLAHLSGSIGQKTWVLLPYSADWRWFENIDHSLWYQNTLLFRQGPSRTWDEIISQLKIKINQII